MADTNSKPPYCSKCGEDAREAALFCHACGGKIVNVPVEEAAASAAWFKDEIIGSDVAEESSEAIEDAKPEAAAATAAADSKPIEKPNESLEPPAESAKPTARESVSPKKPVVKRKRELTSAAELRKRNRSLRTKEVEIVWKENTNSGNLLFVMFGILLTATALVVFLLAMYLS